MAASSSTLLSDAKKLSPGDRLELIGEIWDTLEDSDRPVTAEERAILESRMADLDANPSDEESWPHAKSWLESRHR